MTLKIIGSGFGRTGTMTMKTVLESLGLGPTHHMTELFEHPDHVGLWKDAFEGKDVDWATLFPGYRSQVDWPGALFWHELSIAFPEARVIHTRRPEEEWWASFSRTIGKLISIHETMPLPPHVAEMIRNTSAGFASRYKADLSVKEDAIAAYRRNEERVRDTIPADRLLVFDVAEGWEPLCRFLELPVRTGPLPRTHVREEFWQELGGEPGTAPQASAQTAEA